MFVMTSASKKRQWLCHGSLISVSTLVHGKKATVEMDLRTPNEYKEATVGIL
jgi:hypothetical protein